MSGTISAIIGVLDSAGVRVDLPAPDGTYKPLMLQIDASFTATQTDNGSTTIIKLSVANPPPAGDTWTPFAEFTLIDSTPHDALIYTFPTPPSGQTYEGSSVNISIRARGAQSTPIGMRLEGGARVYFGSGEKAIADAGDSLPAATSPTHELYCDGTDAKVYLRTTSNGCATRIINGEFLVVPTLKLGSIPA
jgi:hypothetical protein